MSGSIQSKEDFDAFVKEVEGHDAYRRPLAFGVGIAYLGASANFHNPVPLDTRFPLPNYSENFGTAAVIASVVGHKEGTKTYSLTEDMLRRIVAHFKPFENDGKHHPNMVLLKRLLGLESKHLRLMVSFIAQADEDPGPQYLSDAYLRLHLLSLRRVKPHGIKLDGIFGVLPNVAHTSVGPVDLNNLDEQRLRVAANGGMLTVNSLDRFPRMLDYVTPSDVRVADASRVRLGAHLGKGTTVMHAGFVNFNAGTLGKSMVEGRISAGVVVGDQTDIGGSASIMGTFSGGGKEVISIGRGCLIGANGGIGISLGDLCAVEAGLYVTAGMPVMYKGSMVKAKTLSGMNGLTFRRNGFSGVIEVLEQPNKVTLNEVLHKN